ncbi:hypothetical protein [Pseudomonas syringae group genomosp. 7]|uniref:hypothetical protein n=1 Tax=Pseudomonas syringae group genomosp. 7 TaxID=251699 RepID=UPI0037705EF9
MFVLLFVWLGGVVVCVVEFVVGLFWVLGWVLRREVGFVLCVCGVVLGGFCLWWGCWVGGCSGYCVFWGWGVVFGGLGEVCGGVFWCGVCGVGCGCVVGGVWGGALGDGW